MAEYCTEQKKMLLSFLQKNGERAYTVEELADGMKRQSGADAPGKSTVYRWMTRLVEEGTVKRFVKGHSRRFVYQITSGERCHFHLHLKCIRCGRLFHLDEALSNELLCRVEDASHFSINEEETVLFGSCLNCNLIKKNEQK